MGKTIDFGSYTYNGKIYKATAEPTLTDAVFPGWFGDAKAGETYTSQWSAPAVDLEGQEVRLYWEFEVVKGEEPDDDSSYDWDKVDHIRE